MAGGGYTHTIGGGQQQQTTFGGQMHAMPGGQQQVRDVYT